MTHHVITSQYIKLAGRPCRVPMSLRIAKQRYVAVNPLCKHTGERVAAGFRDQQARAG